MRPACVFANGPACQIEQLRDQLRGSWREGLRTVMVLLPVHGLSAGEIAALLECHPSTAYRWISRFTGQK
jgi:DNA-directed RNA polymerase specialized sigma24 family protein